VAVVVPMAAPSLPFELNFDEHARIGMPRTKHPHANPSKRAMSVRLDVERIVLL
jgi:hypothetical protein